MNLSGEQLLDTKNIRTDCRTELPILLWVIAAIFLLKTFILAFWVIPLWDIQDEPGHYSYISDISNGKGIPVMGEAYFDEIVRNDWLEGPWKEHYNLNWISQHPPLYYLVNSIILSTARMVTSDSDKLFRITRLLSIVSGTCSVFVFYCIFLHGSNNRNFSLFSTAIISFIPMYGFQSSGTTHDAFLALLCAFAILYWVKFILTGNINFSFIMAIFLSLAAVTKFTSLLLFIPMIAICFFYINEESMPKRLMNLAIISFIAMFLPAIWMLRSYMHYGIFLSTWHNVMESFSPDASWNISLFHYLTSTPIIENLYNTFFGEFGWTGRGGQCRVLLIKNSIHFMPLYLILGSLSVFLSFAAYVKWDFEIYGKKYSYNFLLAILLAILFLTSNIPIKSGFIPLRLTYAIMLAIVVFSLQAIPLSLIKIKRYFAPRSIILPCNVNVLLNNQLTYLSLFVCFFYTIVFIVELKGIYERFHMLRADHGRYWFPIISLIFLAYVLPVFKIVNINKVILYIMIGIMAINEICIYYYYVMPFLKR